MENKNPFITIISHASIDHTPTGTYLGGPVSYGGRMLAELGAHFKVFPKIGSQDFTFREYYKNRITHYHFIENAHTTTFKLSFSQNVRNIQIVAKAEPFNINEIPLEAFKSKYILLSPIIDDMSLSFIQELSHRNPGGIIAIDPFNNDDGKFTFQQKQYFSELLHSVAILKLSQAELLGITNSTDSKQALTSLPPTNCLFLITLGGEGTLIYKQNVIEKIIPSIRKYTPIDTTGCGDIFFSSFLYALSQNYSLVKSVFFGNVCAGLSVKSKGVDSIPSKEEIWNEFNKR
ncbi:MAG: carbohydrate kinase family protein [Candidatus Nanoarchaeia archaeon]